MPLTDTAICKAKPAAGLIKLSDGGGLQLHIHTNGSKYWKLAYRYNGKQKKLAFGVYPEVYLAEAREPDNVAKGLEINETMRDLGSAVPRYLHFYWLRDASGMWRTMVTA